MERSAAPKRPIGIENTVEAMMDFQFNTDNNIEGTDEMASRAEARVRERLARFGSRLTRIEVHVRDVDGATSGPRGIEAVIEARPAGRDPISSSDRGDEPAAAVNAALAKLVTRLDNEFGKLDRLR